MLSEQNNKEEEISSRKKKERIAKNASKGGSPGLKDKREYFVRRLETGGGKGESIRGAWVKPFWRGSRASEVGPEKGSRALRKKLHPCCKRSRK